MYRALDAQHFAFSQGDSQFFKLERLDEHDFLDAKDKELAAADNTYWDDSTNRSVCTHLPASIDHRPRQTAIRNQQDRGTCVCFASLACLEGHFPGQLDLSEQYANWLFMRFQGRDWCQDGLKTTDSADYLSRAGVCEEGLSPYENFATVQTHCLSDPSPAAKAAAYYGIARYTLVDNLGLNGPSIANSDYLECILMQDHDVVFGMHVAWGRPDANGVFDVLLDKYGNPLSSRGGHAMLLVGYDRSGALPYFIFKNSWDLSDGVQGYRYLSYDYVRQYAKYGYFVHAFRKDMA